jgi:hypothetical protein
VSTDLAHPQVLASVGVPSRTSTVVNWRGLSGGSGRLGQPQQSVPILIPTSFPQISRCRNLSHRSCPHKVRWDRWDEFADLRAVSATSHRRAEHLVIRSTRVVESGRDPIS